MGEADVHDTLTSGPTTQDKPLFDCLTLIWLSEKS